MLSLLVPFCAYNFEIIYNIDLTLISIAIIFPLVFAIRGAFKRREKALEFLSLHRGAIKTITYFFMNAAKLPDEAKKEIKAIEIKIASKVGSGDKLFGSVTNADLASAISAKTSEIDKKFITLPGKTIKRLGKYEATIRLHREVSFEFPFEIIADTKA